MCGIVLARTYEEAWEMLEVLAHRGKDDRRIVPTWAGGWFVGQNRLAIVGGKQAYQPFVAKNGAVTTFNGEIYNYKEIRDSLRETTEGTEVAVLSALIEYCSGFSRILDGYYGLIHVRNNLITIARDLLGVVPLYYGVKDGKLAVVASESKAIKNVDHILEVQPGSTIRFNREGHAFDRDKFDPYSLHLEDVDHAHIQFLLKRAVGRRIRHSDAPVSMALSGGLDSSMILWAAAQMRLVGEGFLDEAITVGADPNSDEVQNARELAALCRIDWKFVQVSEEQVMRDCSMIRWHLEDQEDNPVKWRGMLRNYYVAKNAKNKVILCGEGADELGCGYPSHKEAKFGLQLEWKSLSTVWSMPAINLDRVNKGGMAWTKEYRTPFLDRALVLYMLGCKKEIEKGIFRETAKRMGVPEFILNKPKYGEEEKALEAMG